MAWFVYFHIHGRERDPKVNLGQMSLLVLPANKNISQHTTTPEVTNENLCCLYHTELLLVRYFSEVEAISITLLREISHAPAPLLLSLHISLLLLHPVFFFHFFPSLALLSHPLVLPLADQGIAPFIDGSFHSLLLIKPVSTS